MGFASAMLANENGHGHEFHGRKFLRMLVVVVLKRLRVFVDQLCERIENSC